MYFISEKLPCNPSEVISTKWVISCLLYTCSHACRRCEDEAVEEQKGRLRCGSSFLTIDHQAALICWAVLSMRLLTVVIDSKFSLADDKQLIRVWRITVISDHPDLSMLASSVRAYVPLHSLLVVFMFSTKERVPARFSFKLWSLKSADPICLAWATWGPTFIAN